MTPRHHPSRLSAQRLCRHVVCALAIAVCSLPSPGTAVTAVLQALRDTTLYSDGDDLSNGAGEYVFAGRDNAGGLKRALVAFDVAGNVPAGATVTSASLTLQVTRTNFGARSVSLHAVTADWGEAGSDGGAEEGAGGAAQTDDATWKYRFFNTVEWTADGGDFGASADASISVGGLGPYTWSGAGVAARVQAWLDAPAANAGWLLQGDESQGSAKRFASRSHPVPDSRPVLTVEYTPAGGPLDDPIPGAIAKSTVQVELITIASGFAAPVHLTPAPGDAARLFVVDQEGLIRVLEGGQVLDVPFLDVRARLVSPLGVSGTHDENDFDERGLLGLAFHPGFAEAASPGFRRLYTYTSEPYTGPGDFSAEPLPAGMDFNHQSVISEWQVEAGTPLRVDPTTRREIMRIDQPQFNHNAGALNFGPDGYLYIALGDGGGGNDTSEGHGVSGNGQNINTVHGSLLRIDPLPPALTARSGDASGANGQYRIPADNPFVGVDGIDEIFVYGLRNPYRFSFDRQTGELVIADVGQGNIEEIDLAEKGNDLGWNLKEGSFRFDSATGNVSADLAGLPPGLTDPVAEYDHDEGVSIIGGFVYRGGGIPALTGRYVCGDFSTGFGTAAGRLFTADLTTGLINEPMISAGDRPLNAYLKGFGQDAAGELYVLVSDHLGPYGTGGSVLRLAAQPAAEAPPLTMLVGTPRFAEGGQTSVLVSRSLQDGNAAVELAIALTDAEDATAPASATIAAGASAVSFAVETIDDEVFAGDRTVTLSVTAAGYRSVAKDIVVQDNDPPPEDSDGDGMPDAWETQFGLNPGDPDDADEDLDGDGLSNIQEFEADSDPTRYVLRIHPGWSNLSLARVPQDNTVAAVSGGRITHAVWIWQERRYVRTDRFLPLRGHWVFNDTGTIIEIEIQLP